MGTEMGIFLTFGGTLIILFLFGKILLVPLKTIGKLILNSIVGGLLLFVINLAGAGIGILIPLNVVTAVTVGALGIPGVIMLLILCN